MVKLKTSDFKSRTRSRQIPDPTQLEDRIFRTGSDLLLPELDGTDADQISIEAAQPKLDLSILAALPSKTFMVGVIDMADDQAETPETVAARIRAALEHLPPGRVVVAPDCGMKYLSRDLAFAKLSAMTAGAEIVRREIS